MKSTLVIEAEPYEYEFDPDRTALVIIDMQSPEGHALGTVSRRANVNAIPKRNDDEVQLLRRSGAGRLRELPHHVQRRAGARV